ncbi:MAG: type I-D CRISPR-associated protein Cas10d/Csc3 [Leptolyngbya sp. SIO4C1]|nr:type I-D CRISPR-associated protein Cas10d/Csc3 [Leptolyngbya sp. SIO4C1]
MTTLLQTLLIRTLPPDTDLILKEFIDTVLPAMETQFGHMTALGGSQAVHEHRLRKMNDAYATEKAQRWASSPDQSLLVHVTNALLLAWTLTPFLSEPLSDNEKRLICLGLTLHDYNKYCQGEEEDVPKAHEVNEILTLCEEMGERLNFSAFWSDWRQYLSEIGFLAQNTQGKIGTNLIGTNWPKFQLRERRLKNPLRPLLRFGDVAVHMANPAELAMPATGRTRPRGKALKDCLEDLGIKGELTYHRLRQPTGILSNRVHNAVLHFTAALDWQPILYFAQGVVYLSPLSPTAPKRETLKKALWQSISQFLESQMMNGEIGFKRDGKGVKVAPQTRELFESTQIIRELPGVIAANVRNEKDPATPKRLASIGMDATERKALMAVADLRCDLIAER